MYVSSRFGKTRSMEYNQLREKHFEIALSVLDNFVGKTNCLSSLCTELQIVTWNSFSIKCMNC